MKLLEQIKADLKTTLGQRDVVAISTLRFLLSAIHNKEIELKKRGQLTDEEVIGVLNKLAKQYRESIQAFQKGERDELVEKEEKELEILNKYLPQQITPEELKNIIKEVIKGMEEVGEKDFGRVMGAVMEKVKGKADGTEVAKLVREQLVK